MHRRQTLRLLGSAIAFGGLAPDEALALAARVHARVGHAGASGSALDAEQLSTLAVAVDMILPQTDTPGAAAAGVHDFIDLLLAEWYEPEDRARFMAGLADLDARSNTAGGEPFARADESVRVAIFRELDAEEQSGGDRPAGAPVRFFRRLKELTLFGYYTSAIGVEQELRWVAIPGGYDPCAPYMPRSVGGS
jgi:hypothetical protein